jgi:hypothetical protein
VLLGIKVARYFMKQLFLIRMDAIISDSTIIAKSLSAAVCSKAIENRSSLT